MNSMLISAIGISLCAGAQLAPTATALSLPLSAHSSGDVSLAQDERGTRGQTTVQQFMQSLMAYGRWMSHPQFGWVWQPQDVQPWWQPFAVGEWIVTQNGAPYWRSGLPFGWATEHYGAWTFDENRGWLWVPSNEWSAAPVSWRVRDGVVGWAPQLATTANVQAVECPQPAFAWIFIASNRLLTTSNFAVAAQEFGARDAHGTWGAWAHQPEGIGAERMPEPRNPNMLDATRCISAGEVVDVFARARVARGLSTQGPPITWVQRLSQMGTGRVTNGVLNVYAPTISGDAPPQGGSLLVNPPAQRVQRAMPLARSQPIPRSAPIGAAAPIQTRPPVQPVPPALPNPTVVATAPLNNYEAFTYQHEALDEHNAAEYESLQKQHAADETTPPYPGFDQANLPAWKARELQEMQRMAARQRKLLDAKQAAQSEENAATGTAAPQSNASTPGAAAPAPSTTPPASAPPKTP